MAFNKGDKSDSSRVRRGGMHRRKKVCVFCGDKNGEIDYKDVNKLKRYVYHSLRGYGAWQCLLRSQRRGLIQAGRRTDRRGKWIF